MWCVYILQISAKHDDATNLGTLDLWPILDDTIHTLNHHETSHHSLSFAQSCVIVNYIHLPKQMATSLSECFVGKNHQFQLELGLIFWIGILLNNQTQNVNFICTSMACAIGPSVTASSTDSSFQNPVFWNLFEFSAVEITLQSISPTFSIQILPNKFH